MKRKLACIIIFLINLQASKAQPIIFTGNNGLVNFYSSAPLEDIEATNSQVISLLNTGKKIIEIKMLINQFEFKNKLMQQHFNENFMDSKKYPEATFKGKIYENIDFKKPGVYHVSATGEFELHGVERIRTIHGNLIITNSSISIETQFDVLLADHKIDIPEIVFNKVAEKIKISSKVLLSVSAESLVTK
ncbi:MAG: YceI family protein [Sphingobacteriales bacterium]|nr:YceI family protein [Sphingobacteriales bacterium]